MRLHLKYFSLASATILCLVSPLLPTDSTLNSNAFAQQYKPPTRGAPASTEGAGSHLRDDDHLPGNRKAQADRLFQEGVQRLQRGELQTALTTFQQVLAIRRELDDKAGEGQTLLKLAEVYEKLGQNDRAQEYYRQAEAAGVRRGEIDRVDALATVAERTPLRDDNQAEVQNQDSDRAIPPPNPEPIVSQTPLRDDNGSMGTGGDITLSQTTLRDDAQTPLRDDNGSTGGTAAVSATLQRDDDSRRGIRIVATQQTPLRDDNPNRAATRSRQMESDRNNQAIPSPAAAVAQTPQRDDDVPLTTSGATAVAQTPQRDDDADILRDGTVTGRDRVVQRIPLRDDDRHRVTAQQTPLRDDDDNRIATRSTQTAIERKTQADRLFQEGVQQLQRNQLQTALVTFQQVLAIRRELGDKTGEGQAFYQLGKVSEQMGQNQQAQDYYRQARERGIK